ncbi:J domain-containing protein [Cyanobium sp. ATX 6F1]|uniref:J domain-containing protein n=1 Tax=unclassified Cyanobium TaxID=2627006 RepID=UPI0020CDB017|nr:J domain-containing protein [Cyanobium sp. ATX 6F1]MCP9916088.1 J domain-containing protein [Cyanobium sp. ATX 6F1]
MLAKLDALKKEWGLRKRGDLFERLLEMVLPGQEDQDVLEEDASRDAPFHERGALVLVSREAQSELALDFDPEDIADGEADGWAQSTASRAPRSGSGGIDLPGFVRRQTNQVRRSLNPRPAISNGQEPLALVQPGELERALRTAEDHWIDVYGKPANPAVLEASMVWLAQDIWRQSDQSEGRPFSWSLTEQIIQGIAPAWAPQEPSFARVVVAAGLLEDPFSANTLTLRIPTLIRRFVHRFRRRPRGTSFQALENTMTLHGALKLLQLPTTAGHRLTLAAIREAYRLQAASHHPDAGGSVEAMRRLNEAYQLLKELYRQPA